MTNNLKLEGTVSRIGMIPGTFYVVERENRRTYGIDLGRIDGYRGETFKELGIKLGARVLFGTTDDPQIVTNAEVIRG